MNRHFYITYQNRAENSNNYPFDIILESLESYNIAEYYISKFFDHRNNSNSLSIPDYKEPLIITNDIRLHLKYRNVFNFDEFFSYCVNSSKTESELLKLPLNLKYIAFTSKLSGDFGITVFNHFKNIVEGIYKTAYMYTKYAEWTDEENGNTYSYEDEEGWRTNSEMIQNKILKNECHYYEDTEIKEINITDYHFFWWNNLDKDWKRFFSYKVENGIFGGIPTTDALIELLTLDTIKLYSYNEHLAKVNNIEPLKEFKKLKVLTTKGNNIQDLTPLQHLIHLQILDCSDNLINNLEPLHDLNELEDLNVSGNKLCKIEKFWGLNNLKKLILNNNKIEDLTSMSNMLFLEHLEINSNNIHDLTPLSNLKKIKYLSLSNNQISNLEPLRNLKTLEVLIIKDNNILDIEPLKKLENLSHLAFDNNKVEDLDPITNLKVLKRLGCGKNKITYAEALEASSIINCSLEFF